MLSELVVQHLAHQALSTTKTSYSIMRPATFFAYLFFLLFSLFALAAALPAEPANGPIAVARADLTGVFDKILDMRDTANLPKSNDTVDSTEGTNPNNNDNNRAICPRGYGYCASTRVCCPTGGWCCSDRRCCLAGSVCQPNRLVVDP
jgi:hypothetical protein